MTGRGVELAVARLERSDMRGGLSGFPGHRFAHPGYTPIRPAGQPMEITIRPARAAEIPAAQELVVHSINDLTQRHGFGAMATVRTPDFQLFSLQDHPDGLWVAEAGDEMVGCAFSWVNDGFWFLAELFVLPTRQAGGIGRRLLAATLEHARKSQASNKALITFTFNTVSQALYIRHGMFPRLPIYFFSANRDALPARIEGERLPYTNIAMTVSDRENLRRIDASALGFSREKHHGYLSTETTTRRLLLHSGGECVGYAYVNSLGHIGPVAVVRQDFMAPAFRTALSVAAEMGSPQISAFLPGTNEAALSIAVANGMRINFPMVLVSERDFGDWTRYLPRNPGFM